ncbi:hypothetical protein Q31b_07940 [Novipirellula aureliae]|uniref:Uncharacterized protein n=1 Tax=Novipirellula aureliae TaxID=2527966 RepID=A0A5C6E9U8_9BACT|nr:hypothetical protein Q31b_07940 [Novipirellula aureliae]
MMASMLIRRPGPKVAHPTRLITVVRLEANPLLRFFRFLGKDRCSKTQFVCSDMWQAYLKVIAQ